MSIPKTDALPLGDAPSPSGPRPPDKRKRRDSAFGPWLQWGWAGKCVDFSRDPQPALYFIHLHRRKHDNASTLTEEKPTLRGASARIINALALSFNVAFTQTNSARRKPYQNMNSTGRLARASTVFRKPKTDARNFSPRPAPHRASNSDGSSGNSSYCGAFSGMTSHGAFEPTKICALI